MNPAKIQETLGSDRSAWRTMAFGDFAESVGDRVEPRDAETDVYVGLEHIDPECLHIKRWGTPSDVTGTKLKFKKGDIIFGRRRAYQRKLAVAGFDGICSAHAMVVRAKPKVVLPEFLPFLMQSDRFMTRAVEISVGSLSPTINWKTLKKEEFPLPPIAEQRRIAEILWAADEVVRTKAATLEKAQDALNVSRVQLTLGRGERGPRQHTSLGPIPKHWRVLSLGQLLAQCQYGLSIPLHAKGKYPILRMMNYLDDEVVANDLKYVDLPPDQYQAFRVHSGDLLFNRTNSPDLVGKIGIFRLQGDYVFASYLIRLRVDSRHLLSEYLNAFMNSRVGQARILAYSTPGVCQANISAGSLKKLLVPVPPLEDQRLICEKLARLKNAKNELSAALRDDRRLLNALVDSLLQGGSHV